MRILFVYAVPPDSDKNYTGYHHGIGTLSAVLRSAGHSTALFTASSPDRTVIDRVVKEFKPDLAALSVTSLQYPLARKIGHYLFANHAIPLVYGGIHAVVRPDAILEEEGVLAVCTGEGEAALPELAAALETGTAPGPIPNLQFKNDPAPRRDRPVFTLQLDRLPVPDRDIFDFQKILDRYGRIMGAEFIGSRGCPYACAYCANQHLNRMYGPGYYRRRSVDNLVREIRAVRERYRFGLVGFHDDIFTFDQEWLMEFADKYRHQIGLPFWCNTRPDCVDRRKMHLLKTAGCRRLHIGLESGSADIRKRVLNRDLSDEEVAEAFALAREQGIRTMSFTMIGLPFETEADIRSTIALNRRVRPDRVQVTVFTPYPGTTLYDLCSAEGFLPAGTGAESLFDPGGCLVQPSLAPETIGTYYRDFVSLVYS